MTAAQQKPMTVYEMRIEPGPRWRDRFQCDDETRAESTTMAIIEI